MTLRTLWNLFGFYPPHRVELRIRLSNDNYTTLIFNGTALEFSRFAIRDKRLRGLWVDSMGYYNHGTMVIILNLSKIRAKRWYRKYKRQLKYKDFEKLDWLKDIK